jgi:4'-phosphopantetheinyl transferase EntD
MTAEERLRARLPKDIVLVVDDGSAGHAPLTPIETEAVAGASRKRTREFAIGRDCARRALVELGMESSAIPVGTLREPAWPEGVTGSITHRDSCWAVAVTHSSAYRAIGIDAEVHRALHPRVSRMVLSEDEYLPQYKLSHPTHWEMIVFSIKEAIFKAWSPTQRCWLNFADARVRLRPEEQTFEAQITHDDPGPFRVVRGIFDVHKGMVFTAVLVP